MGKTLGIGSFGKARHRRGGACPAPALTLHSPLPTPQVKLAEHALTGYKVAIKILNRKKIRAMDMDEKGEPHRPFAAAPPSTDLCLG